MSQINKISSATKDAIKRKSAYALPDRPSDQGMKPEDIKRAFWQPIVDVTFSAISEIDRVIDELNTIMTGNYDAHIADKNNPHAVTKAQVGLGNCNNTADADKPVSTPQRTALNTHNTATDAHNDIRTAITEAVSDMEDEIERLEGLISEGGTVVYVDGSPVSTLNIDEISVANAYFAEEAGKAKDYAATGSIARKFKKLEARIAALEA